MPLLNPVQPTLLMIVFSLFLTACGGGGSNGGNPTPENPAPAPPPAPVEPAPENPAPENPDPENPAPDPQPENPDPLPPLPDGGGFAQKLSAYNIYSGVAQDLTPQAGYNHYSLSGGLYSNHAEKQRLIRLPANQKMTAWGSGLPQFPDGTLLVKTFYYYDDVRLPDGGKRIIETRLLKKAAGQWEVGTYLWNAQQTDASLIHNGYRTQVSWLTANGNRKTINYSVPDDGQCVDCHQQSNRIAALGPTLRNMNIDINTGNVFENQLQRFQRLGLLSNVDTDAISTIADYSDPTLPAYERGRAYLDMNCAHCHNPQGWNRAARKRYDFRYETPLARTRIPEKKNKIVSEVSRGRMPFRGITDVDQEGVAVLREFVNQL